MIRQRLFKVFNVCEVVACSRKSLFCEAVQSGGRLFEALQRFSNVLKFLMFLNVQKSFECVPSFD